MQPFHRYLLIHRLETPRQRSSLGAAGMLYMLGSLAEGGYSSCKGNLAVSD